MKRDYIKQRENALVTRLNEISSKVASRANVLNKKQKIFLSVVAALIIMPILLVSICVFNKPAAIDEDGMISVANTAFAVATTKRGIITVPSGMKKADPFLPYRDIGEGNAVHDVPAFNLVEPLEVVNVDSDAARLMDTIVSGILYDKYSPSAILNIEGNDYLVKKGDVINNYKVMNITQDAVTVKLGTNTYTAGIGEILTEGSVNYNKVSNLNKKFGGAK